MVTPAHRTCLLGLSPGLNLACCLSFGSPASSVMANPGLGVVGGRAVKKRSRWPTAWGGARCWVGLRHDQALGLSRAGAPGVECGVAWKRAVGLWTSFLASALHVAGARPVKAEDSAWGRVRDGGTVTLRGGGQSLSPHHPHRLLGAGLPAEVTARQLLTQPLRSLRGNSPGGLSAHGLGCPQGQGCHMAAP